MRNYNPITKMLTMDALMPPTKQVLDEFKTNIKKMGFNIESERKNASGGVHYQVRFERKVDEQSFFKRLAKRMDIVISNIKNKYNADATYNIGWEKNGDVTAGVDIRDIIVKDAKTVDDDTTVSTILTEISKNLKKLDAKVNKLNVEAKRRNVIAEDVPFDQRYLNSIVGLMQKADSYIDSIKLVH